MTKFYDTNDGFTFDEDPRDRYGCVFEAEYDPANKDIRFVIRGPDNYETCRLTKEDLAEFKARMEKMFHMLETRG